MRSQTSGLKIGLKSKALFTIKIKHRIYDCCRGPDVTCGDTSLDASRKGSFADPYRVALTGCCGSASPPYQHLATIRSY
jgi:hypothetical protein